MKSLVITGCMTIFLLLQSCGPTAKEQDKLQYQLIQGDWISDNDTLPEHLKLVFSFTDSVCSIYKTENQPFPFRIRNNVLFVCKQTSSFRQQPGYLLYAFTIEQLDEEHLLLHPTKGTLSRRPKGQHLPLALDYTIALRKMQQQNTIQPTRITFNSSTCYGTCPAMTIEIDQDHRVKFLGEHYTSKTGGYNGKLSGRQYQQLLQRVHQVAFNTIDPSKFSIAVDAPVYRFRLEYNGKQLDYTTDGSNLPIELEILFGQLMQLYRRVELSPDASVKDYFRKTKISSIPPIERTIQFLPPVVPED